MAINIRFEAKCKYGITEDTTFGKLVDIMRKNKLNFDDIFSKSGNPNYKTKGVNINE